MKYGSSEEKHVLLGTLCIQHNLIFKYLHEWLIQNNKKKLHTEEELHTATFHTELWLPDQQHKSLTTVHMKSTVIWVDMLCSS
jgi:hypothetical protein